MPAPSKSQVRKAGSTLRAFTQGKASEQERLAALEVIAEYRRTFADPLLKVNNGLRSFLATEGIEAEVSQRLKRMETIVEKLTYREKGLDLSRMGDIGGCRIVISENNIPNIYRIWERIEYRWGSTGAGGTLMTKNSNVIEHFLLIYDRKEDKLLSSRSYGTDGDVAARAYREAELRYHDRPEIDIVLVGSDSLETVKRTHSTYFRGFTAHDLQQLVDSLSFE